jgi:sulfide:quinone oxidoreductase
MRIVKLAEGYAVSEQITPTEVAAIAQAGYRVLINNRPDNEVPGQPASADIAAAAAAAGLE